MLSDAVVVAAPVLMRGNALINVYRSHQRDRREHD
jgi:hypothetical protein